MTDHKSDCAVHNEPAMPAGPCDCGAGIVEAMARAIAGFYGPNFDECLPTRQVVKHEANHGRADINDNDQELHYYAASAALTVALDHMRKPSPELIKAIDAACHNNWPDARTMAIEMNDALISHHLKEALP